MSLTKKEYLTEQYLNFIKEIKTIIETDIFPKFTTMENFKIKKLCLEN